MRRRLSATLLALALVSSMLVVGGATTAGADIVTLALNCQADSPIGPQPANQDLDLDVTAPSTVDVGEQFTVVAASTPGTVAGSQDSSVGTVTINYTEDYRIELPVPANATFVGATLSGGFNYGTGTPTVGLDGTDVVLQVPGPIPTDEEFQLPTINVELEAADAGGSTIETHLGGTSFSDPGFTLSVNADIPFFGNNDLATTCYPAPPNPPLSTTTISSGPDVTAPSVTIATPADGASYAIGSVVDASYTCTDDTGVAYCTGDVADGDPIDTSTLGPKTFTVSSEDTLGNGPTVEVHGYTVIASGDDKTPPTIDLVTPAQGAVFATGAAVGASYSCADTDSGVQSCVGDVADGAAVDTSTPGTHEFRVDALDNSGNPHSVVHQYTVQGGGVQQDFDGGSHGPNRIPVDCDTLFGAFDESIPVDNPPSNVAPTEVGSGGTFHWDLGISPDVIPPFNDGSDLLYRFRAPSNGQFVSAQLLDGGEHVNGAAVQIVGGKLELSIASVDDDPGLISNDPFRPPKFRATIEATGPVGSDVTTDLEYFELTTTLGGTSHCPTPDPPDPNPTLVTTTIVDATPPAITVTTPAQGALVQPGDVVLADYACTDPSGVATCTGDVAAGDPIDTSTSGVHQLQFTSTDNEGNTAQEFVTYVVDDPTVSVADAAATEGAGAQLDFDVTLSNPSSKAVTVDYATADGSALDGVDYTATNGTLTWNPGDPLTQSVPVDVLDDATWHPDREMTLELSGPTNATVDDGSGTGTITDDEPSPPQVRIGDTSLGESQSGERTTAKFTVNLDRPAAGQVTVSYSTSSGTATSGQDFKPKVGKTVKFKAGQTSKAVVVKVLGDDVAEGDETFTVTLSSPTGGAVVARDTGTATILDDDPTAGLQARIGDALLVEGDSGKVSKAFLTVTLDEEPVDVVTVGYSTVAGTATAGPDYKAKTNKTLKFKPGKTTKIVVVNVYPDLLPEGDEQFTVTLSGPTGGASIARDTGTVTIVDND